MSMEYKYDVFICYSRRDYVDAKGKVLPNSPVVKIREAFDREGISYWFDEEGIHSSEEFMRKIVQAIAESKMLVFISSKASNESHWTAGEILEALDGKKAIFPVKIDNSRYNDSFRLSLLPLDYIDYRRNPERSIDRLIASVMVKVGKKRRKKEEDPVPDPLKPGMPLKKVFGYVSVIVLLVVVGLYIAAWVSSSGRSSNNAATATSYKINGHEYVDLGLSVKWATCNIGALSPFDYGDYFAWGEVSTKSEFLEGNSQTYGKNYGDIGGNSSTDAVRANWGGSWRLPTRSECEELVNNCTWTWTTMNGKNGYRVTGKNGNSIFLPAAGWRYGASLDRAGSYGFYWSSAPIEDNTYRAYYLYYNRDGLGVNWGYRYGGRSVRPVSE